MYTYLAADRTNETAPVFRVMLFLNYPEEGVRNFLRNMGNYTPVYTALQHRKTTNAIKNKAVHYLSPMYKRN
jgi:hypothetical protein